MNDTKRVKIENIKKLIAATKIQKAWRNLGKEKEGVITSEIPSENPVDEAECASI